MNHRLAAVLAAAALVAPATAQINFAWVRNAPNTHNTLSIEASPLGGTIHLAVERSISASFRLEQVDVNGDREWLVDLPTDGFPSQVSAMLAVDAGGRSALLVQDQAEVSIRIFESDGSPGWTRSLGAYAEGVRAHDLEFTTDGDLVTLSMDAAGNYLRRFDAAGTELAPFTVQGPGGSFPSPLHIDDAGKIYFAARSAPGNLTLWRLHPDATLDDSRAIPVSSNSKLVAIDVDAAGNIFTATNRGAMSRHDIRQITQALTLGWSSSWNSSDNNRTDIVGLTCMADGSIVAYGNWVRSPHYGRYDASGTETETYTFPTNGRFLEAVEPTNDAVVLLGWRADPQPTGPDQRVLLRTIPLQGPATTELLDNGVHLKQESKAFAIDSRGDLVVGVEGSFTGGPGERAMLWRLSASVAPSAPLCSPAEPNSTGSSATLTALGSNVAAEDNVALVVDAAPVQTVVLFLASMTTGFTPSVAGSQGSLCLAGSIGRYLRPGEVRTSSETGGASLLIPLDRTPQPTMTVGVLAGQSWAFQAWYRDANPSPTSNFTNAIVIDFL